MSIRYIIFTIIAFTLGMLRSIVGLHFSFVILAGVILAIIYCFNLDKKATVYILNTINKRIT